MGDPLTWYLLGRTVADPETIMEVIDDKFATHNQDPSAHGQSSEVVYVHRNEEEIDHLNYSIYNIKVQPVSRTFKAIVDVGGATEYSTIQGGIDYANLHGGGRVLIKQGTYTLTDDLTLYSNIILEGEDMDLTILDFSNALKQILAVGTVGTRKRNIELRNLEVKDSAVSDKPVVHFNYTDDCDIFRCKFAEHHDSIEAVTYCLYIQNSNRMAVDKSQFLDSDQGIEVRDSDYCKIERCYINDIDKQVLQLVDSDQFAFRENYLLNNGVLSPETMIYLGGTFTDAMFDSNVVNGVKVLCIWNEGGDRISIINNVFIGGASSTQCLALVGVNRCIITSNRIKDFGDDGINLSSNADNNVIGNNVITDNGGWGVEIADANCDNNLVVGNNVFNNTGGTVNDQGTGSEVAHNVS